MLPPNGSRGSVRPWFRALLPALIGLLIVTAWSVTARADKANAPIPAATLALMAARGTHAASPIVLRAYKKESEIELWKRNAAGRYVHKVDQHDAPLDPNFLGAGRCLTDNEGRYRFLTIKPGAYPWGNHPNAWRPNHIHFSLFGDYFGQRLVTQMYFPGDPLLAYDPIFQGTPEQARDRLISRFSMDITEEGYALGYEFDIVLRGRDATPTER